MFVETARDLSDEDRKENDYSLEHGFRLLSAYRTNAGETSWGAETVDYEKIAAAAVEGMKAADP